MGRYGWLARLGLIPAAAALAGCLQVGRPPVYKAGYRGGVYHTVRPGQTLWRISQAYGVDVEQVAVLNGLSDPDRLEAGVRVFIPRATRRVHVPAGRGGERPRRWPRWARRSGEENGRARADRASSRKVLLSRRRREAGSSNGRLRFDWPVRGRILRQFGTRNGTRFDGIDIAAAPSATVRASAPGRVIFSDWGPGSYGRTIIIRHNGGEYHSVYAHNAANLVRKGDAVRRGTPIASVGRAGHQHVAKLHFEIRHRTIPRDPLVFLP